MHALIIVWRESLEALLVVGVLLGWIARQNEPARLRLGVWLGVAGGIVLAVLLGIATFLVRDQLQGQVLEAFQIGIVLVAAALIVLMVLWMRQHGRHMRQELEQRASHAAGVAKIGIVTALAVAREGAETVIFLYGLGLEPGTTALTGTLAAAGAGFLLALATAWGIARGARLLSYRVLFRVSEALLLLIAAALLASAIDRLIGMDWLPPLLDPVWDSSALLDDASGPGRLLTELIGYRSRPCGMLLIAYTLFWIVVGIALRCAGGSRSAPRRT